MTKTYYIAGNKRQTPNFSGMIRDIDFDTEYVGTKHLSDRILASMKFDRQCEKNARLRDERERNTKLGGY